MKILKVKAKGEIDERRLLPENPNIGDMYRIGYWDYPESMREYLIYTESGVTTMKC